MIMTEPWAYGAESVFRSALKMLLDNGDNVIETAPRGMKTLEMLNCRLVYDFSASSPFCSRYLEPNVQRYFARELQWYMSGSDKLADIVEGSSFQAKASNDGVHLNSAYGARLFGTHDERPLYASQVKGGAETVFGNVFDQMQYCADLLTIDPNSRRAVAAIFERADTYEDLSLDFKSNDVPCTIALQWVIRPGKHRHERNIPYLHQIVTMRSNDVWRGFVYDVPCFAFIHGYMLAKINEQAPNHAKVALGKYYHNVHSLHLYDRWAKAAQGLLATPDVVWEDWMEQFPFEHEEFLPAINGFAAGDKHEDFSYLMNDYSKDAWTGLHKWYHQDKAKWTWEVMAK